VNPNEQCVVIQPHNADGHKTGGEGRVLRPLLHESLK
jgi:hypothetical protein